VELNISQSAAKSIGRVVDHLPAWVCGLKAKLLLDAVAAGTALVATFLIRFEFRTSPWFPSLFFWIPVIAGIRPLVLLVSRAYRPTWRHFNLADAFDLALKSIAVTFVLLVFRLSHSFSLPVRALPFSVALIELNLFVLFAGCFRMLHRSAQAALRATNEPACRTLLFADADSMAGAVRLVEPYPDVRVIGIITDDAKLQGRSIAGMPVLGGLGELQKVIVAHTVELVLMASGGLKPPEEIVAKVTEVGAQVRILPTARDLIRGRVRVSRTLRLEQLVSAPRQSSANLHPDVVSCLDRRCVLVTGAGGSIGSEIARQIVKFPVSKLILLDQDENSIFELMNELAGVPLELAPCVGDIRDADMLEELFASHAPGVVLHAAAYKHVPVMESNPCEAVLNNVTGTRQLAGAAVRFKCERFVMISTDKAVSPSSVMGATKRTAEILIQHQALQSGRDSGTQFACVRFGNVVGSRGSVVPIFLRQIASGGPLTITHEEMTRYFMSISQAVELVLQAATLASTGDVYMLDMGDPVKIIDFARHLIRMSGLRPDVDIPIQIVGSRPGEKLHEQLWRQDSEVSSTIFPCVYRVKARALPHDLPAQIGRLERGAALRADHDEIHDLLKALPIDYVRTRQVMRTSSDSPRLTSDTTRAVAAGDD
jgi:FlaA1/EpsC-like NDP-sugar epimerase